MFLLVFLTLNMYSTCSLFFLNSWHRPLKVSILLRLYCMRILSNTRVASTFAPRLLKQILRLFDQDSQLVWNVESVLKQIEVELNF